MPRYAFSGLWWQAGKLDKTFKGAEAQKRRGPRTKLEVR
jgi:hypothetical protein